MTKFKCEKCNKMVSIIEEQEEQVCFNCGTKYEYDRGWYDIKGVRTEKCFYCRKNIFIPKLQKGESENRNKIQCT